MFDENSQFEIKKSKKKKKKLSVNLQKLNRNFMTAKNSNGSNRINRLKKLETEIDTEN